MSAGSAIGTLAGTLAGSPIEMMSLKPTSTPLLGRLNSIGFFVASVKFPNVTVADSREDQPFLVLGQVCILVNGICMYHFSFICRHFVSRRSTKTTVQLSVIVVSHLLVHLLPVQTQKEL